MRVANLAINYVTVSFFYGKLLGIKKRSLWNKSRISCHTRTHSHTLNIYHFCNHMVGKPSVGCFKCRLQSKYSVLKPYYLQLLMFTSFIHVNNHNSWRFVQGATRLYLMTVGVRIQHPRAQEKRCTKWKKPISTYLYVVVKPGCTVSL